VRIDSVKANNHKRVFELELGGKKYPFPYARAEVVPTADDRIVSMEIDRETACEGFVYVLASGAEGYVHGEQALDYNRDPDYMRNLLLFRLTMEAQKRLKGSGLSKREIIRRLDTSPAQFYRLIDQTNYSKTVDSMLTLLRVLDCEIEVIVKDRTA
jgi:hypothetical protein